MSPRVRARRRLFTAIWRHKTRLFWGCVWSWLGFLGLLSCEPLRASRDLSATSAAGGASGSGGSSSAGAGGDSAQGGSGASGEPLDCGPESPLPVAAPLLGPEGPSCVGGLTCGDRSCCETRLVPGGTFPMGRSLHGTDRVPQFDLDVSHRNELPEHCATVGAFYLDTFEVTVGRFAAFLQVYDQWVAAGFPMEGQGANPNVKPDPVALTGWHYTLIGDGFWGTAANTAYFLHCSPNTLRQTWPNDDKPEGATLGLPLTCIRWAEALAFCLWDGGRLPTEAEWEFAAAGGAENRLYPWGSQEPDCSLADLGCSSPLTYRSVGSSTGAGRFGQFDLAGGVVEWVFDWYSGYLIVDAKPASCDNCVFSGGSEHVVRGGSILDDPLSLRATWRQNFTSNYGLDTVGFRCAREVPHEN